MKPHKATAETALPSSPVRPSRYAPSPASPASPPALHRSRSSTDDTFSSFEMDVECVLSAGYSHEPEQITAKSFSKSSFFGSRSFFSRSPSSKQKEQHNSPDLVSMMDRMELSQSKTMSRKYKESIPPVLHRIRFETPSGTETSTTRNKATRHRRNLAQVISWGSK